ncbi:hypothetical protein HMPREF2531_04669 [Bacteroides intestinalis]|uniref:Uncharacterized protein n=1 Tax=Bacteroides intestinalis TaxID=329854 RepID=A0A139KTU1_9BACE|nr:hypothetical protein HMPREF2531_04669 [Bacteroides intestinalis]
MSFFVYKDIQRKTLYLKRRQFCFSTSYISFTSLSSKYTN